MNSGWWKKAVVLTLLSIFGMHLTLAIYNTLTARAEALPFHPLTFHTFWELSALLSILWVVRQIRVDLGHFMVNGFMLAFISAIVILLSPLSLPRISSNYWGVESRVSLETHETGQFDESTEYDYPLQLGGLHRTDCPSLQAEVTREKEGNEYVNVRGFLTWQGGLARGFTPDSSCITEYRPPRQFEERMQLFLTVGPLSIVEIFVEAFSTHFLPALGVQIVWFLVKRDSIWH